MKKIVLLILVLCIITTSFANAVVLAESVNSQPSVSGLYIEGTPMLGETLTLNYVVNNPDGSLTDLEDKVKWLKQGAKYYVRNADWNYDSKAENLLQTGSLTFTIPDDESLIGKYISVWIPVASITDRGRMRTMGIGPISARKTDDMIASSVTIVPGNDNGVGSDCGDKLLGKFIAPDTAYTCQWYVADIAEGAFAPIEGATDDYYIIPEELYGKYIKFGITPEGKNTLMSDNVVLAGNAAFGAFVYGKVGTGRCYEGCALNSLTNGIISDTGGAIFTYADSAGTIHSNAHVIADLGTYVKVSQIALKLSGVDNDYFTLECSDTGADGSWTEMVPVELKQGTTNGVATNKTGISYANFDEHYTTRYVKVSFTHIKNTTFSEMMVISKEDKAPVLTLEGDEEINLLLGQEYVEPGYFAEDFEDGDLTEYVEVDGNVDINQIGEYVIKYSVTDFASRPHTVTVTRKVNVSDGFQKDGDMAFHKDVEISSGSNPDALVDGNQYTSWTAGSGESSAVVDLGEQKIVSKIEIEETGNNVKWFKLYGSDDGNEYTLITSDDDGMGTYTEDINPCEIRYLKLVVNSDNGGAINSFCVYFDDLGKVKYAADKIEIDAPLNNVTEDLALSDSGYFDTKIEWQSNNTSVVSNNGAVKRGTSDQKVVITAKVSLGECSVTRDFELTVTKKIPIVSGGGGHSSNGGSSGGGGSRGGGSITVPYTPSVTAKPVVQPETEKKSVFNDITEEHWAYEYIEYLYNLKLVSGFGDGSFGAEEQLTRAQYLKMVMEALGLSAEGSSDFKDVSENDWYYKYVNSAVKLGIVNGLGDGSFGADDPISRQDMAVISAKALKCVNLLPEFSSTSIFTDYADISGYAVEAVERMSKAGIISGDANGAFRPNSIATRAEAAKIVTLLYKLKGGI